MKEKIGTLAAHMTRRKQQGMEPYVFMLGAGMSMSAGCPSYLELARKFLESMPNTLEAVGSIPEEAERDREIVRAFKQEWQATGEASQRAFLSQLLGQPTGTAHKHLASLMQMGYAKTVLTTNLDSLLEAALADVGWLGERHYDKIVVSLGSGANVARRIEALGRGPKVIKLHGTLEDPGSYAFLTQETYEFEVPVRKVLQRLLNRDIVIIGSRMNDRDLDIIEKGQGNEIWFVNPSGRREGRFAEVLEVCGACGHVISGDDASADLFLGALRGATEDDVEKRPDLVAAEDATPTAQSALAPGADQLTRAPTPADQEPSQPTLFIVSGPSAAGKDAILLSVLHRLRARGYSANILGKFSTRKTRNSEARNESYLSLSKTPSAR